MRKVLLGGVLLALSGCGGTGGNGANTMSDTNATAVPLDDGAQNSLDAMNEARENMSGVEDTTR